MYKSVLRLFAPCAVALCTLGWAAAPALPAHAAHTVGALAPTKAPITNSWCYDPYWGWYQCSYY